MNFLKFLLGLFVIGTIFLILAVGLGPVIDLLFTGIATFFWFFIVVAAMVAIPWAIGAIVVALINGVRNLFGGV